MRWAQCERVRGVCVRVERDEKWERRWRVWSRLREARARGEEGEVGLVVEEGLEESEDEGEEEEEVAVVVLGEAAAEERSARWMSFLASVTS